MWLYTKHGFFSITRNPLAPHLIQVRARRREDIEYAARRLLEINLSRADRAILTASVEAVKIGEIIETDLTDYGYRILVEPDAAVDFIRELAQSIDYPNFKDTIKDERRGRAYMRVWQDTIALDDRAPAASLFNYFPDYDEGPDDPDSFDNLDRDLFGGSMPDEDGE